MSKPVTNRGRNQGNCLVPNIWKNVSELNFSESHLGVNRAINEARIKGWKPEQTTISQNTIREKLYQNAPKLIWEGTANDLVGALNVLRANKNMEPLSIKSEVVPFEFMLIGNKSFLGEPRTEHGNTMDKILDDLGNELPEKIVINCLYGHLLPESTVNTVYECCKKYCDVQIGHSKPNRRKGIRPVNSESVRILAPYLVT